MAGNIREYTNKEDTLRPSDTGIDATVRAARVIGQNYNEAGSAIAQTGERYGSAIKAAGEVAVDFATHREISAGAANFATQTDDLTAKWNKTANAADPNDPTVAAKFQSEVLEPQLQKFQNGFWTEGGNKWAEARVEALRTHMHNTAAADMSSLAAKAVSTNMRTLSNQMSNTAMRDPSSVDFLLSGIDKTVGGVVDSSPNLKGAAAATARMALTEDMRESIVKAGAIGAIRNAADPEAEADKWSAKYPQYIKGMEVKQLADAARQQNRFQAAEDRANKAQAKADSIEAFHKAANQFELDSTKTDQTTGAVVPQVIPNMRERLTEVTTMPNADPSRVAALIKRAESVGVSTDENSKRNLDTRSRATQADMTDQVLKGAITSASDFDKAYVRGDLTWEAKEQLKRNFLTDRSESGQAIAQRRAQNITAMETTIDPARTSLGSKSAEGSIALDQYQQWLRRKEEEARTQGKDPQSIYDYTGNGTGPSIASAGAQQFRVTLQQSISSRVKTLTGQPSKNLTGNGSTITGISVTDVPAPLRAIPNLGYNKTTGESYDPATKTYYDKSGNKINK